MAFEKDFGYLMPFLRRVEDAAASLADPSASAELRALMRDEQARWARIRALLEGAQGAAVGPAPSPRSGGAEAPEPPGGFHLTVGSLRGR